MRAQLILDLKTLAKDRLTYAALILLACALAFPLYMEPRHMTYTWEAPSSFGVDHYEGNLHRLIEAESQISDELSLEESQRRKQVLLDVLRYNRSGDKAAMFAAMLEYEKLYLDTMSPQFPKELVFWEARIARLQAHIEQGIFLIYESSWEMPGVNYLGQVITRVSPLLWFLPAVLLCSALMSSARGSRSHALSSLVSVPSWKILVSHLATVLLGSLAVVMLACVPVFTFMTVLNGVGSFNYPVVNALAGSVQVIDLLTYFGEFFVLFLCGSLFLSSVILLLGSFIDSRILQIAIGIVLVIIPGMSLYSYTTGSLQTLLPYLPITYFNIEMILGSAETFISDIQGQHLSLFRTTTITLWMGAAVLSLCSLIMLTIACVSRRLIRYNKL
jgi:hypothetical protein